MKGKSPSRLAGRWNSPTAVQSKRRAAPQGARRAESRRERGGGSKRLTAPSAGSAPPIHGSTALPLRGAREQAPGGAPRLSSYRKARATRRQGFSPANRARIISPSCPASRGGHSDGARRPRGHRGTPLRGAPPQGTAALRREEGPAPPSAQGLGHHRCYPHCPVRSQPGRQSGRNRASSAPNASPGAA